MIDPEPGRVGRWLTWAVVAAFAIAIPYTLLNAPSKLVGSTRGVIEATRGQQSDTFPTTQFVTVRLASGEVLNAKTVPGILADTGDIAYVRTYERRFSGARIHEVYRIEGGR